MGLSWLCTNAIAQENVIEEILVTASKKGTTSLLETAVTATVVTGDQVDFRDIRNAEDLQFQTPGMIMDMGLATPKLSIRGIGHDNFSCRLKTVWPSTLTIFISDVPKAC